MRIAVLTNDYPPVCGGAGRIAALQVDMLKAAGDEVRVWHHPSEWPPEPMVRRVFRHVQDLKPRPELVKEMSEWKPDVLITHNLTSCGFGTPKQIQKTGVRWVHVLHDVQLFEPSGQLADARRMSFGQMIWIWLRFFALGFPDLIISPTKWLLTQHQRRGFFRSKRTRCDVLPNPSPSIKNIERYPHDPVRLLFVGRVAPEKGSRFLVNLLNGTKTSCELHVVGDGPDVTRLQRLPNVTVHGNLSAEDVMRRMGECDVLLVPSRIEENQPTVLLEAAALGLPIIAASKGGIPETVGADGLVIPPGDVSAWIKAVSAVTSDYQSFVERAYRLAARHDPSAYRDSFLSLLKSNR